MQNDQKPVVSVVVGTFNQEHYIGDCLSSIVNQNCTFSFEVIVGDDGSKDKTPSIVSSFAKKFPDIVIPVIREKNVGATKNYFDLIKRARGKYICHIDGDDLMLPWKLRKQVDFLESNPTCNAVYHNGVCFNDNQEFTGVFNNHIPEKFDRNFLIKKGNFLFHSSLMYHSKFRERFFVDFPVLDYLLHVLLANDGDLGYINAVLGGYRVNSETSMLLNNNPAVLEGYYYALLTSYKNGTVESDIHSAVGMFLCDRFLVSLKTFKFKSYQFWATRVSKDYSKKAAFYNIFFYCSLMYRISCYPIKFIAKKISSKRSAIPALHKR